MQELSIKNAKLPNEIKWLPNGLFSNCSKLRKLDIQKTPLKEEILEIVIKGIYPKEFTMQHCDLVNLPKSFIDFSQHLIRLDLSHNLLRSVFL